MRIAFVQRGTGHGFFAADRAVLAVGHQVDDLWYDGRSKLSFVRDCFRAAARTDALYTIFASEHALLAAVVFKLRRRRIVVAVGGYDTACDRGHGYGLSANRRRWVPSAVVRLADRLVAHSDFALDELLRHHPEAGSKAARAYLSVDLDRWPDPGVTRDPEQIVTVATVSRESFSRKGIDRFLRAAAADPQRRYVLAGRVLADARVLVGSPATNVRCTGPLDDDELNRLLWGSGVYVQLSWHETFGMALAEAMACGCTPVISAQEALVEVAQPWAVVGALGSDAGDGGLIESAVRAPIDREAMRADVGCRFSPELRRAALDAALGAPASE